MVYMWNGSTNYPFFIRERVHLYFYWHLQSPYFKYFIGTTHFIAVMTVA